jgi:hypothetical protein
MIKIVNKRKIKLWDTDSENPELILSDKNQMADCEREYANVKNPEFVNLEFLYKFIRDEEISDM